MHLHFMLSISTSTFLDVEQAKSDEQEAHEGLLCMPRASVFSLTDPPVGAEIPCLKGI